VLCYRAAEFNDNIVGTDEELIPPERIRRVTSANPLGEYRLKLRSPSRGRSEYGDSDDKGAPFDASPHTGTWARHRALRMPAMRLRYVSRSICPDQYVIAISEYIVEAVARCRSDSLRLPVWR